MEWTCRCGQVRLKADIDAARDSRIVCYCASCREFAEKTGAANTLDAAGGADLIQTAVERVSIVSGKDHLAWTQLTAKGPIRWFATCCGAPVANTLRTRQVPFITLMTPGFAETDGLPEISGRVNRKGATARIEGDSGNPKKAVRAFMLRALKSRLGGGYKRNPFFDAQGNLIAEGPTELPGKA